MSKGLKTAAYETITCLFNDGVFADGTRVHEGKLYENGKPNVGLKYVGGLFYFGTDLANAEIDGVRATYEAEATQNLQAALQHYETALKDFAVAIEVAAKAGDSTNELAVWQEALASKAKTVTALQTEVATFKNIQFDVATIIDALNVAVSATGGDPLPPADQPSEPVEEKPVVPTPPPFVPNIPLPNDNNSQPSAPEQGEGNETTPEQGEGNETTPEQGEGNETAPEQGEGNGTTPEQGEGNETAPEQGEGNGTTPEQGEGNETSPEQGEGNETAPEQGEGNETAPEQGEGNETSPEQGEENAETALNDQITQLLTSLQGTAFTQADIEQALQQLNVPYTFEVSVVDALLTKNITITATDTEKNEVVTVTYTVFSI